MTQSHRQSASDTWHLLNRTTYSVIHLRLSPELPRCQAVQD